MKITEIPFVGRMSNCYVLNQVVHKVNTWLESVCSVMFSNPWLCDWWTCIDCYVGVLEKVTLEGLSPWSRVFEELVVPQHLAKRFPVFYGTLRFTSVFTGAIHLPLHCAHESYPCLPILSSLISILMSPLLFCPSGDFIQSPRAFYIPPSPL